MPRRTVDLTRYPPEFRQLAADLARALPGAKVIGTDSIPPAGPPVTAETLGLPVKLVGLNPRHVARRRRR